MSLIANTNFDAVDYVSRLDTGSDPKTIFKIKPLDGLQGLEIMHKLTRDDVGNFRMSGPGLKLALHYGLDGWENMFDDKGNVVLFNRSNVNKLPASVLVEVASEIINRTKFE